MSTALYVITGPPGCGKTTTIRLIAEKLRLIGIPIGGMITSEVRRGGIRVGFEILDVSTGKSLPLAGLGNEEPRIGKYSVYISNIEEIGVKSILQAIDNNSVVIIDEVGPMELMSRKFIESVERALSQSRIIVATVHFTSRHQLAEKLRRKATRLIQLRRGASMHELDKIASELSQEIGVRFRRSVDE